MTVEELQVKIQLDNSQFERELKKIKNDFEDLNKKAKNALQSDDAAKAEDAYRKVANEVAKVKARFDELLNAKNQSSNSAASAIRKQVQALNTQLEATQKTISELSKQKIEIENNSLEKQAQKDGTLQGLSAPEIANIMSRMSEAQSGLVQIKNEAGQIATYTKEQFNQMSDLTQQINEATMAESALRSQFELASNDLVMSSAELNTAYERLSQLEAEAEWLDNKMANLDVNSEEFIQLQNTWLEIQKEIESIQNKLPYIREEQASWKAEVEQTQGKLADTMKTIGELKTKYESLEKTGEQNNKKTAQLKKNVEGVNTASKQTNSIWKQLTASFSLSHLLVSAITKVIQNMKNAVSETVQDFAMFDKYKGGIYNFNSAMSSIATYANQVKVTFGLIGVQLIKNLEPAISRTLQSLAKIAEFFNKLTAAYGGESTFMGVNPDYKIDYADQVGYEEWESKVEAYNTKIAALDEQYNKDLQKYYEDLATYEEKLQAAYDDINKSEKESQKNAEKLLYTISGFDELNIMGSQSDDIEDTIKTLEDYNLPDYPEFPEPPDYSQVEFPKFDLLDDDGNELFQVQELSQGWKDFGEVLQKTHEFLGLDDMSLGDLLKTIGLASVAVGLLKNNFLNKNSALSTQTGLTAADADETENLKNKFGDLLGGIGVLVPGLVGLGGVIGDVTGKEEELGETGDVVWNPQPVLNFATVASSALGVLQQKVQVVGQKFAEFKTGLAVSFASAFATVKSWASNVVLSISTAMSSVMNSVAVGFNSAVQNAYTFAVSSAQSIWSWGTNIANNVATAMNNVGVNIRSGLSTAVSNISIFVSSTSTNIANWCSNTAKNVQSWASNVATNVGNAVVNMATNIAAFVRSASSQVASWVSNTASNISNWAVNVANNVGSALATAWENFKSFMKATGEKISSWFSRNWASVAAGVGAAGVGAAAIAAVKGSFSAIGSYVSGIASSIGQAFTSAASAAAGLIMPMIIQPEYISPKGNVKMYANGGVISAPTFGLMGEYSGAKYNPEIITPESKMREVFMTSNEAVVDTLIQTTRQLLAAIDNKDMSVSIGDDVIAKSVVRSNNNYKRRTGATLFA